MVRTNYAGSVFVNCPFDDAYEPIRNALIFSIFDCGFQPRSALEENDNGVVRIEKIQKIIADCKFGIHDISRTELDVHNSLPRFNMPLELGLFIGARRFGDKKQKLKNCLVLDRERYRYQQFISDISGQDIRSHNDSPRDAIRAVREWLNATTGRRTIPGGAQISRKYDQFLLDLPDICRNAGLADDEMTYNDYCNFASYWLMAKDA